MATIEHIYPEYIHLDGDTQPRAKIDQAVCDEYGERMKAGEKFPPIDVFFDGKDYWLADGFHRLQAYAMAVPGEPIECNLFEGSLQDAQWHSYSVNKTHGLRRTNEDKIRAVHTALMHAKGMELSDKALAEHVGVSQPFVSKIRNSLAATYNGYKSGSSTGEANPQIPQTSPVTCPNSPSHRGSGENLGKIPPEPSNHEQPDCQPRFRTGRDGRTTNTAKIGRTKSRKAIPPRSPAELAQARRDGYRGRPGSMVKLELPNNHVHNCAFDLLEHFTFQYLEKVFQEVVQIHNQRQA